MLKDKTHSYTAHNTFATSKAIKKMKNILIEAIAEHLFGRKYYANIINCRGTFDVMISSSVFLDKQSAYKHRDSLFGNTSYQYIETVSFRSRKNYSPNQRVKKK